MNPNTQKLVASLNRHLRPIPAAHIAACPHVVEQPGLSREHLGDEGFTEALQERRTWFGDNLVGDHRGEAVRDSEGNITGRRFFFANPNDAFFFSMRF